MPARKQSATAVAAFRRASGEAHGLLEISSLQELGEVANSDGENSGDEEGVTEAAST